jgi:hypothetical protein
VWSGWSSSGRVASFSGWPASVPASLAAFRGCNRVGFNQIVARLGAGIIDRIIRRECMLYCL